MEVAKGFAQRHIPADAIWLDIDYMDGYRVFTWDPKRFPQPKKMLQDLSAINFKTVAIVDPGVKLDPGYAVFDGRRESRCLCQNQGWQAVLRWGLAGRLGLPRLHRCAGA